MYTSCYLCGEEGHRRAECPSREGVPVAAPGLSAAPSNRPEDRPIPVPVPADDRAQYGDTAPWAEWLREKMGWPAHASEINEASSRAKAAEQVSEARAARSVLP